MLGSSNRQLIRFSTKMLSKYLRVYGPLWQRRWYHIWNNFISHHTKRNIKFTVRYRNTPLLFRSELNFCRILNAICHLPPRTQFLSPSSIRTFCNFIWVLFLFLLEFTLLAWCELLLAIIRMQNSFYLRALNVKKSTCSGRIQFCSFFLVLREFQ